MESAEPCRTSAVDRHFAQDSVRTARHAQDRNLTIEPPTPSNIHAMQRPAPFLQGLIHLLKHALESQSGTFHAALSGSLDHFHATPQDASWGCGWRNMQMLSSHLLHRGKEFREALYCGCGYTPDISSLQAWLECAWAAGFDTEGAEQLGGRIQGTDKWVGTTEAAALLRQFGVRAHVVDFRGCQESSQQQRNGHPSKAAAMMACRDWVPVHSGVQCNKCGVCPIRGPRYSSQALSNYNLCGKCWGLDGVEATGPFSEMLSPADERRYSSGNQKEHSVDHTVLLDWVWHYFTGERSHKQSQAYTAMEACKGGVVSMSGKPPLYFQHEGHSRTIVGIEKSEGGDGQEAQVYLLVLDPAMGSAQLERALSSHVGWQRLIKRSPCWLQKPEYQLLHCLDGLATGEELEELKIMRASEQYGFS